MSTKFGTLLASRVTSNLAALVAVANACDLAYCLGIDNAYGEHKDFDESNPEAVAQNLAGLQAVVSSVSAIALLRGVDIDDEDEGAQAILSDIVNDNLNSDEEGLVLRFANATWGAGQSFRTDKGALGRATRVNFFDDLPADEVAKDMHQVRAAAQFVLEQVYS